jgi:hypothetical protein
VTAPTTIRGPSGRDLDRTERRRVRRRRTQAHALGDVRHREQREDRRLVEEVVEDGDPVEPRDFDAACDRLVLLDGLVRLGAEQKQQKSPCRAFQWAVLGSNQ